jgi:hypothetical protein
MTGFNRLLSLCHLAQQRSQGTAKNRRIRWRNSRPAPAAHRLSLGHKARQIDRKSAGPVATVTAAGEEEVVAPNRALQAHLPLPARPVHLRRRALF